MEKRTLSDEEVIALDTILVEGNEKIIGLHLERYTYGIRYGIDIPTTVYINKDCMLEELQGRAPMSCFEAYVRAIVNDVVYLSARLDGGKVYRFGIKGDYRKDYSMGDMAESSVITPILRKESK